MRVRVFLLALSCAALVACGGGGGGGDTTADVPSGGGDGGGDPGVDVVTGDDTGGDPIEARFTMELFGGLQSPAQELVEARLPVSVRLFDANTGELGTAQTVEFTVDVVNPPTAGEANGGFEEPVALTDENGVATLYFETGSGSGALYRITISSAAAVNDVELMVQVGEPPTGGIDVTFTYDGQPAPATVRILLLNDDRYQCDGFNPGAPPTQPFHEGTVPFADGGWGTDGVMQSAHWIILLIGIDGEGSVVAGGCRAGVRVIADMPTEIAITMQPAGLHLPGVYALAETVDLTAAIPADVDTLHGLLADAIGDPRAALTDRFATVIADSVEIPEPDPEPEPEPEPDPDNPDDPEPDPITPAECVEMWNAAVGPAVESALPATADWIAPFETLPTTLNDALSGVALQGAVTISGTAPGPFTGVIRWEGLAMELGAGRVEWTAATWPQTTYPIRLADEGTTWTARVDGYDELVVETHEMTLEPGRLVAAIVTERLLAAAPGGVGTLETSALAFFDCASIVAALPADVTTCLAEEEISVTAMTETCEQIVVELVQPATDVVEGWVIPTASVSLTGTATIVDIDQNLGVDRTEDGALAGSSIIDGTDGGAVSGQFELTAQ